jgi:hypothetical protein
MLYLPIEIVSKIMLYNIHPVAQLVKNVHPTVRIIKPIIKKHIELNKAYEMFYPEDNQEFLNFIDYYMYLSSDNPYINHNNPDGIL